MYNIYTFYNGNIDIITCWAQVTWRKADNTNANSWEFHSVRDAFENGASFEETKGERTIKPNYNNEQSFKVADANFVRLLTRSAGAFRML